MTDCRTIMASEKLFKLLFHQEHARCKWFRRFRFGEDVIISERDGGENAMALEYERRGAAECWEFFTWTKMLQTKRLQRLWRGYVSI